MSILPGKYKIVYLLLLCGSSLWCQFLFNYIYFFMALFYPFRSLLLLCSLISISAMGQDQISVDSARHANKHIGSVAQGFVVLIIRSTAIIRCTFQQQAAANHAILNMQR